MWNKRAEKRKKIIKLISYLLSNGDIHIVALPCDFYKISYLLHYPSSKI